MSITDYYDGYGSAISTTSGVEQLASAILIITMVMSAISFLISVLVLVSQWIIFKKNNKPGWYVLIPILNNWMLLDIVGIQGWWSLIPFANIYFMFLANYKLAIKMGKSKGVAIIVMLIPVIGYPMLAFSKTKVANVANENVNNNQNMNVNNDVMFCPECGKKNLKQAVFCSECGKKMK